MGGLGQLARSLLTRPIPGSLRRFLSPIKVGLDIAAWALALGVASAVRISMTEASLSVGVLLRVIAFASIAQVLLGYWRGLYLGRWRYGSFDEVAGLTRVTMAASIVMIVLERPSRPRTPVSAMLVGTAMALLFMAAFRYCWRLVLELRRRPRETDERVTRLLIFGAGDRGCGIIDDVLGSKNSSYLPVGLIDDDPSKRRLSVRGVQVLGTRRQLAATARNVRASALLVAVAEVSSELMADLLEQADRCNPPLKVKVLSPLESLFGEKATTASIRDLSEEDLLGRHRIETDLDAIAHSIRGKRVLVTGAGGSIGSELCRQLSRFGPDRLVMMDRDESALHGVELSIKGTALLDSPDLVLADLRDRDRIMQMMKEVRPHVVFHAAALKHLPLLEANPGEAVKTNVWGTQAMLDAALAVDVERFVNISTDKAADPISVLGYSKRIAERLTAHAALEAATGTYVSVRFGNVLGSRGSVLTTFKRQIADGHAVTVTDRDVTRYFMLVSEAVQLVIQAAAVGEPGEVLVLDMGDPVRIADVATALLRRSTKSIPIEYTGLRPGEKIHEVLLAIDEDDRRPNHPLITQTMVAPLDPQRTCFIDADAEPAIVVEMLRELCFAIDVDVVERMFEHRRIGA